MRTVLVIEEPPLAECSTSTHQGDGSPLSPNEKENVFEVALLKGIGGLGMSLVGGIDCSEEYGGRILQAPIHPVYKTLQGSHILAKTGTFTLQGHSSSIVCLSACYSLCLLGGQTHILQTTRETL